MDTFTDPRDGNTYKTVEINNQIWMAENLRYEGVTHYAPNGDKYNIPKYGCLYTWDKAIKAVPEGWRLPTKEELNALAKLGSTTLLYIPWNLSSNSSGFSAHMAGSCCRDYYYDLGNFAFIWSSKESDAYLAYGLYLSGSTEVVMRCSKDYAYSVRCIKD